MLPSDIQEGIDTSPDFTAMFTQKVETVRNSLLAVIQVPITHDKDMNYSNGQRLCIGLDTSGHAIPRETAAYELHVYISSKAALFAFHFLRLIGKNEWRPVGERDVPQADETISRVAEMLVSLGYERVIEPDLHKEVPGQFTEMDGAPATVFDVLFSELA